METDKPSAWSYAVAPGRIDAFNFASIKAELTSMAAEYTCLAYDLSGLDFMCLPMIQLLHTLGADVGLRGGRMVLIGASEKIKRQFSIYASLDPFLCVSPEGWKALREPESTV